MDIVILEYLTHLIALGPALTKAMLEGTHIVASGGDVTTTATTTPTTTMTMTGIPGLDPLQKAQNEWRTGAAFGAGYILSSTPNINLVAALIDHSGIIEIVKKLSTSKKDDAYLITTTFENELKKAMIDSTSTPETDTRESSTLTPSSSSSPYTTTTSSSSSYSTSCPIPPTILFDLFANRMIKLEKDHEDDEYLDALYQQVLHTQSLTDPLMKSLA